MDLIQRPNHYPIHFHHSKSVIFPSYLFHSTNFNYAKSIILKNVMGGSHFYLTDIRSFPYSHFSPIPFTSSNGICFILNAKEIRKRNKLIPTIYSHSPNSSHGIYFSDNGWIKTPLSSMSGIMGNPKCIEEKEWNIPNPINNISLYILGIILFNTMRRSMAQNRILRSVTSNFLYIREKYHSSEYEMVKIL